MDSGKEKASQLLNKLNTLEKFITASAFIILIATMFLDVLSREITGVGLHWARQVGVYANIIVVMFGLGVASGSAAHLRPRFADNWLPGSWEPVLERLQDGMMSVFCLLVAFFAAQVTFESARLGEVSSLLPILIWPILSVIPLAFVLTALRHCLYTMFPQLKPDDPIKRPTA